jgi:hypothetical protein
MEPGRTFPVARTQNGGCSIAETNKNTISSEYSQSSLQEPLTRPFAQTRNFARRLFQNAVSDLSYCGE